MRYLWYYYYKATHESYFPVVFKEKDTKCECVQDLICVLFVLCRD